MTRERPRPEPTFLRARVCVAWFAATFFTIVDLTAQSAEPSVHWSLSIELRIGNEISDEYALTTVRHMAVAPDGVMFVLQPRDAVVRVFDRSGKFLRYMGRRGNGPGEFVGNPSAIGVRGDTVWIMDRERIHFFKRDGELIQTTLMRYSTGHPLLHPGGPNFILKDGAYAAVPLFTPDPSQALLRAVPVLRVSRNGQVQDTLGFHDLSLFRFHRSSTPRPQLLTIPLEVYALSAYAPGGDFVAFIQQSAAERAGTHRFRFTRVAFLGDTVVDREVLYQPVPVPSKVRDSIRSAVGRAGNAVLPRPQLEAVLRIAPIPRFYPPVQKLRVSADSSVWLQLQGTNPRAWLVLDRLGRPRARVDGPPSLEVLAASSTHVWGVERDSLDVSSVVRYRINR